MIKIHRRPNESVERLISKFNKLFQASRKGLKAQEKKHFRKKLNRRKQRIKAVKRDQYRAKREKNQFR